MNDGMPFRSCLIYLSALMVSSVGCQPAPSETKLQEVEDAMSATEASPMTENSMQTVESNAEKLVVEIRSHRGIGRGKIAIPGPTWPNKVVLQIHLRGLESLTVKTNGIEWESNVSSSLGYAITSRFKDADHVATTESPVVHVMPKKQPISLIPLTEGQFFEVVLPRKLFDSNPTEIEVAWIDFYR